MINYSILIYLLQSCSSDPSEQSNCSSHFLLASIHCPFLHWNSLGWQRCEVAEWDVTKNEMCSAKIDKYKKECNINRMVGNKNIRFYRKDSGYY